MTTQGESKLGSIQLQENWDRDIWSPSEAHSSQQDIYIALADLDQKIKTLKSRTDSDLTHFKNIRVSSLQERIDALEAERVRLLTIVKEIRKACKASEWPEIEVRFLVLPTNDCSPDTLKPVLQEVGKRQLSDAPNSSYPVGSIIKPNPAKRVEKQSHNVDQLVLQEAPPQKDSIEENSSGVLGFTTTWAIFAIAAYIVKSNKTTLNYYETLKVWFYESTGTILTWAICFGIAVVVVCFTIWFVKKPRLEKNETDHRDTTDNKGFINQLFSGNFGLARTFWLLYFFPKISLNMALDAFPALYASPLIVFMLLAFEVACCIAVWRAASCYKGLAFWKWVSKFLVSLVLLQDLLALLTIT